MLQFFFRAELNPKKERPRDREDEEYYDGEEDEEEEDIQFYNEEDADFQPQPDSQPGGFPIGGPIPGDGVPHNPYNPYGTGPAYGGNQPDLGRLGSNLIR